MGEVQPLYLVDELNPVPDSLYYDEETGIWTDNDGNVIDLADFDYDENYTYEVTASSGDTVTVICITPDPDAAPGYFKLTAVGSLLIEERTGPDPLTLTFAKGYLGDVRVNVEGEYGENDYLYASIVDPVEINVGNEYTAAEFEELNAQYEFQEFDSEGNEITAAIGDHVTVLSLSVEGDMEDPETIKFTITNKGEADVYYEEGDTFEIAEHRLDGDYLDIIVSQSLDDGDVYKYMTQIEEPSTSVIGETVPTSSSASGWQEWDEESSIHVSSTANYLVLIECDSNDVCKKETWVNFRESSTVTLEEFVTELNAQSEMATIGVAAVSGDDIAVTPSEQFNQVLAALEGGQGSAVATYWAQFKAELLKISNDAANAVDPDPSVNVIYGGNTVFSANAGQITYNKYD